MLSSGDQPLRRLKWAGVEQFISPVFALIDSNSDSSLLAKEQEWPPNCFISPNAS